MRNWNAIECFTPTVQACDAWNGGRDFARGNSGSGECYVTRQEFLEKGAEFLKEHRLSNRYFRTPTPEGPS